MRVVAEGGPQPGEQPDSLDRATAGQVLVADDLQVARGHRAPDGVGRVGVGVHPHPWVVVEGRRDGVADADAAERHVARRDGLGELHDVRLDAPVVEGEQGAGAAEPGDHLVGDQQHVVAVADLADAGEVVVLRHDDPARPLDRLGQEHGDGVRPLALDRPLELVGGRDALAYPGRRLVAIGVRRGDVDEPGHARLEQGPVGGEPGGAHGGEGDAVVALDAGDDLGLVGPAAQLPVGAGHLDAALGRLAAPAREEEPVDRRVGDVREPLGQLDRRPVRAAGVPRGVGQGLGLGPRRLRELAPAVTGEHVPQPGQAVDVLPAVGVEQKRPLAPDPDPRGLVGRGVVEGVNEVRGVAGDELGVGLGRGRQRHRQRPEGAPGSSPVRR